MSRADASIELLEIVLRECAEGHGQPWYPIDYAAATGVDPTALNNALDHLRIGGLLQLTEWIKGKGQGYALTPQGEQVLRKPYLLGLLREGNVAVAIPAPTAPPATDELREPSTERGERVRNALLNNSRPVVTYTILAFNILIFLAPQMVGPQNILQKTAIGPVSLDDVREHGRWWLLLTSAFCHLQITHIALNMFALYSLGTLTERLWGRPLYIVVYLVSAVSGSIGHILTSPHPVLGASGAICGLLTSMGIWVLLNMAYLPRDLTRSWIGSVLSNMLFIAIISMLPGVSTGAHFGGAIGGALVSVPLVFARFGEGWIRTAGIAGVILAVLAPFAVMDWTLSNEREGLQALDREGEQARQQFAPKLTKADEIIWTANEQHARDLLKNGPPLNDPSVGEARKGFQTAVRKLEALRIELDNAGPFADKRVTKALKTAGEYVQLGEQYFRDFDAALAPAAAWDAAKRRALQKAWAKVLAKRDECRASIVLGWQGQ